MELILVIALVALFVILRKSRKEKKRADEAQAKLAELQGTIDAKYAEADEAAKRKLQEADQIADEILAEAKEEKSRRITELNANLEDIERKKHEDFALAKAILKEARLKLASAESEWVQMKHKARQHYDDTVREARQYYDNTVRQALEDLEKARAGALEQKEKTIELQNKAETFRKAIEAYKNVIEGYGDEYLVPGRSLLDDLAEHFGFTEAGQKLKDARAYTKAMMKKNLAGRCDYVEESRARYAINFVVDAFNGKVDTILAKIKGGENYGKSKKAIEDAFTLVNANGVAFRNARITEHFLEARLNELHWGCVAFELKKQEQEEQRAIRERMREEARAQAEFERAKAQAEKEEKAIRAALEKAKAEMLKASDAQKLKYEEQLNKLAERLAEAEAKAQRATSMAEMTKSGHVYVISNIGSFGENVFKIGMTRRLEPMERVNELGDASVPFPFDVHAMIYSEDAPKLENALHNMFERNRVNKINTRKEFFKVSLDEISKEVESLGYQAQFTLLAKAEEYRESLNIEKSYQQQVDDAVTA